MPFSVQASGAIALASIQSKKQPAPQSASQPTLQSASRLVTAHQADQAFTPTVAEKTSRAAAALTIAGKALLEKIAAIQSDKNEGAHPEDDQINMARIAQLSSKVVAALATDPDKFFADMREADKGEPGSLYLDLFRMFSLDLGTIGAAKDTSREYRYAVPGKGNKAVSASDGTGSLIGDRIARQKAALHLLAPDMQPSRMLKNPQQWEANLASLSARLATHTTSLTPQELNSYNDELNHILAREIHGKLMQGFVNGAPAPLKEYLAGRILNPARLNLVRQENKPAYTPQEIIAGFVQGDKGNCATVAAIKLAMLRFGSLDNIFSQLRKVDKGAYALTMRDGTSLEVTASEIAQAEASASFIKSANDEIRSVAVFLYAVSAKRVLLEGNDGIGPEKMSFGAALDSLANGESSMDSIERLGLSGHVEIFHDFADRRPRDTSMFSYISERTPGHSVVVSQDKFDYYGSVRDVMEDICIPLTNDPANAQAVDLRFAEGIRLKPYRV
jgi:hypothetical protein